MIDFLILSCLFKHIWFANTNPYHIPFPGTRWHDPNASCFHGIYHGIVNMSRVMYLEAKGHVFIHHLILMYYLDLWVSICFNRSNSIHYFQKWVLCFQLRAIPRIRKEDSYILNSTPKHICLYQMNIWGMRFHHRSRDLPLLLCKHQLCDVSWVISFTLFFISLFIKVLRWLWVHTRWCLRICRDALFWFWRIGFGLFIEILVIFLLICIIGRCLIDFKTIFVLVLVRSIVVCFITIVCFHFFHFEIVIHEIFISRSKEVVVFTVIIVKLLRALLFLTLFSFFLIYVTFVVIIFIKMYLLLALFLLSVILFVCAIDIFHYPLALTWSLREGFVILLVHFVVLLGRLLRHCILQLIVCAHHLFVVKILVLVLRMICGSFSTLVLREQNTLVPCVQIVILFFGHWVSGVWSPGVHEVYAVYRFCSWLVGLTHVVLAHLLKVYRWLLLQIWAHTSHAFVHLHLPTFAPSMRGNVGVIRIPVCSLSEDRIFCAQLLPILPIKLSMIY